MIFEIYKMKLEIQTQKDPNFVRKQEEIFYFIFYFIIIIFYFWNPTDKNK